MVSVYFWAQLQKLLIICADGEMLEEEFFLCLKLLCQSWEHCRQEHKETCTYLFISLSHFNSWEPIEKYINEQYEKFLKEEVNIARKKRIPDTRVHCCLYFISPTGHSYVHNPLSFLQPLTPLHQI